MCISVCISAISRLHAAVIARPDTPHAVLLRPKRRRAVGRTSRLPIEALVEARTMTGTGVRADRAELDRLTDEDEVHRRRRRVLVYDDVGGHEHLGLHSRDAVG